METCRHPLFGHYGTDVIRHGNPYFSSMVANGVHQLSRDAAWPFHMGERDTSKGVHTKLPRDSPPFRQDWSPYGSRDSVIQVPPPPSRVTTPGPADRDDDKQPKSGFTIDRILGIKKCSDSQDRVSEPQNSQENLITSSFNLWKPYADDVAQVVHVVPTVAHLPTPVATYTTSPKPPAQCPPNLHKFYGLKITPPPVKILPSVSSAFKPVKRKNISCPHCRQAFSNKGQLDGHIRIHSGEKPFKCDFQSCSRAFARNEELTRHRRIHSGDKPHECPVCHKRFGRKDHLNKHQKTHLKVSEKKVYQCTLAGCGLRYTRSDALTRHQTAIHFPKPPKLP